ncbi:MAG: divalent cation tolerance protein CutA [Candidatus Nanosalina sp.]
MNHVKVVISATSKEEADQISDMMIRNELIAGTMIHSGPSRYHWDGEIVENEYFRVQGHRLAKHKEKIIEKVEEIHEDEVPIIEFTEIDGNSGFIDCIEESVK